MDWYHRLFPKRNPIPPPPRCGECDSLITIRNGEVIVLHRDSCPMIQESRSQ